MQIQEWQILLREGGAFALMAMFLWLFVPKLLRSIHDDQSKSLQVFADQMNAERALFAAEEKANRELFLNEIATVRQKADERIVPIVERIADLTEAIRACPRRD